MKMNKHDKIKKALNKKYLAAGSSQEFCSGVNVGIFYLRFLLKSRKKNASFKYISVN